MERPLPQWFDDAKFGIFVHWTAATVPAFAPVGPSPFDLPPEDAFRLSPYVEWYQNSLSIEGSPVWEHHRQHYADVGYDAFVRQFLANLAGWSPEPWAELFALAGATYVVFVTKHHDGVLLWPSATPNPFRGAEWQSERDVVGELCSAVRDRGMRFGTYYSGGLDWTFGGLPIADFSSMIAAIPQSDEYVAYADAHWRELIDRYQPCVMWNDIGYPAAADLPKLFDDYWAVVPDGVVNNRFDFIRQMSGDLHTDFITPEYSTSAPPGGRKWESTRGLGTSFGYNRFEPESSYMTATEIVHQLVDVVARGGNLLLNVGPAADGAIPWVQAERLLAVGWWLRTNGAALYGSRPWERPEGVTGDGVPVRFTAGADGALYAVLLGAASSRHLVIDELAPPTGATVRLLGFDDALSWSAEGKGVRIELPDIPAASPAPVLRIDPAP
ncbi:MAG: alpha-L-fucosidase [Actinomycetota bacterium]|nr:alpha-L-fucosidase [Actinomycetota bacterium]